MRRHNRGYIAAVLQLSGVLFLFFNATAAEKADPANADVKRELARVQKAIDDALKREKNVYSKMFG